MSVIAFLLLIALGGLIVGALGRLALPGPDPMTIGQTMLVGIAGSFAGGLVMWLIFGRHAGSLLLSVAFAALIVYLIRRSRGGSITSPGRLPDDR
jgi:uncharacterized membrane protein YeaQ/YmgE (transglycosylase-associated protein family)